MSRVSFRPTSRNLLAITLSASLVWTAEVSAQEKTAPFRLVQAIPLGHVEGRIDHLAIDLHGQRLFVAARGNGTVEVVDLRSGRQSDSLAGFHGPQGVAFLPGLNRLVVTNGENGTCQILDGGSLKVIQPIALGADADNIRFDDQAQSLYVGYGNGAIGVIHATNGQLSASITLKAHPESFQLERLGPKMFVNLPDADQIAVVDRPQRRVIATWPTGATHANFPMALDEGNHRLFVGCRDPAKLLVFDTESGAVVTTLDSVGDADDIFYDVQRKRIYLSGGEGFIQIVEQLNVNEYRTAAKLTTAPGARTSLFVPELNRLFLAVAHRNRQPAEVRIYTVQPS